MSSRGSRTLARPAENRTNRRFIVQHVLAREAGEPFIYAVIRNKAIAQGRVTAEEWKKASETSHIVFPNRDSEWSAVLDRAVHNDYMYGALDASRADGRIDQECINPQDRKSTPWGDQQWNIVVGPLADEGLVVVEVLAGRPQAQVGVVVLARPGQLPVRAREQRAGRAAGSAQRHHPPPCEPGRRRPRPP